MSKIKLICFPYAGGSALIFSKWKLYLNTSIELVPVELAGRGKRIKEPLYSSANEMINDVYDIVREDIKTTPYALLGHSMGGMIAYELAQQIRKRGLPEPLHIFFSGRHAPHVIRSDEKKYHLLSTEEFKKEIIDLGGTSPEFFDHPELLELFIPLLKNDLKLSETELYDNEIIPLNCNITVFLGKDEDLISEQCDGWKKHTTKLCSINYLNGGHFFILDQTEQIVKIINNALTLNT